MKFKVLVALFIGLFFTIPAMLLAQNDSGSARISYIEGSVGLNLKQAEINMLISERDELSTQKGRVEVYLDGTCLRLNHYTKVVFANLQEPMLVDIQYGEVYIEAKTTIEVKTPHEVFPVEGVYRIEVDRYKTKKFHNLMLEDDFDKWTYRRQKELSRPVAADYRENYRAYYDQYYFSPHWYPYWGGINWYVGWYSHWYWSWANWYLDWYPYWHWGGWYGWYSWYPMWYYYSYYPYYYYYPHRYYYGYYPDRYYRDDSRVLTTVRKSQLQRRVPQSAKVGAKQLRKSTVTGQFSKTSPSVKSLRSPGKIYPSRIRDSRDSNLRSPTRQSSSNYIRPYSNRSKSPTLSRSTTPRSKSSSSYIKPYSSYSPSSRVLSRSPSRSYSAPSFSRTITSRSFSAPSFSRSFSAPSRSFGSTSSHGPSGPIRKK